MVTLKICFLHFKGHRLVSDIDCRAYRENLVYSKLSRIKVFFCSWECSYIHFGWIRNPCAFAVFANVLAKI